MWNEPSKQKLSQVPGLYETEHVPMEDKIVHLHFFIGGCDWYIFETDGTDICFGYAILNNDYEMAEPGYISLAELRSINIGGIEVDCDQYWEPRPASQVDPICKGMGWPLCIS